MNKLLIICGPTATGKTNLAVSLAKKFNGEIINADSRQVYKGMDIGTGKDIPRNSEFNPFDKLRVDAEQGRSIKIQNSRLRASFAEVATKAEQSFGGQAKFKFKSIKLEIGYRLKNGIPIWLVDVVYPDYPFNVNDYVKCARAVIKYLHSRNILPILVGGTGFYIRSLLNPPQTISLPPDMMLRKSLEGVSVDKLQEKLESIDIEKWHKMNNSDRNNPRRLIRAIEVGRLIHLRGGRLNPPAGKHLPGGEATTSTSGMVEESNQTLLIGLLQSNDELKKKIKERVEKRVREGIVQEIKNLLINGFDWNLPGPNTIGYKEWKPYFEEKKSQGEVLSNWANHEYHYAKRQLTWFNKEKNIVWFDISDPTYIEKIETEVQKWYTSV